MINHYTTISDHYTTVIIRREFKFAWFPKSEFKGAGFDVKTGTIWFEKYVDVYLHNVHIRRLKYVDYIAEELIK